MNLYDYITSTGVIVPNTSEIKKNIESFLKQQFGSDINLEPETPQGVLVTALTLALDNSVRNNAMLANQINPAIAGGIFLDSLSALFGAERIERTRSVINSVKLTGRPLTTIPAKSKARNSTNDLFETVYPVVLNENGLAFVDMRATEYGPIECGAGDLDSIATSVLGWEKVFNETSAILGRDEESDASLSQKRTLTLAKNNISVNEAIISSLYELEGVHSLSYIENFTNKDQVIRGMNVAARTIYTCVYGGIKEEIAKVLKDNKTLGAGYTGTEEVSIIDEFSDQEYVVKFDRPSIVNLFAKVTVKSGAADTKSLIPDVIERFGKGELEIDRGFLVGSDVSAFEIASAINFVDSHVFVRDVQVSKDGKSWSSMIDVAVNEVAQIQKSAVQVIEI